MIQNFPKCYQIILDREGGLSNHPADPGGLTYQGITQGEFSEWLHWHKMPNRSVTKMTPNERGEIYHTSYWKSVRGDELPLGIDLVVYNASVNSGPGAAVRLLQQSLMGPKVDGKLGPITMNAVKMANARVVIINYHNAYERFYRSIRTFPIFGRGWLTRNEIVTKAALAMLPAPQ